MLACSSAKSWTHEGTQRSETINGTVVSKDTNRLYQSRIWGFGRKLHSVCPHRGARMTRSEKKRNEEDEGICWRYAAGPSSKRASVRQRPLRMQTHCTLRRSVDSRTRKGATALLMAVQRGHVAIVRLLLPCYCSISCYVGQFRPKAEGNACPSLRNRLETPKMSPTGRLARSFLRSPNWSYRSQDGSSARSRGQDSSVGVQF